MFRIYYSDRVVEGETREDWIAAQDDDVQVVAVFAPPTRPLPDRFLTGYVHCGLSDRQLFTGVDCYDPLNTGHQKRGRWLSDEQYFLLWERAVGDK